VFSDKTAEELVVDEAPNGNNFVFLINFLENT
jgi:hypothetical protein